MPKVYSYIRFSSKQQAYGDSLRRQTADTQRWAATHGHELDEALTFRDLGQSAFDGSNLTSGALGTFVRAAKAGKIERGSILAIEALDRLTRAEPMEAFRLLSSIVECGISIVTISDGRVYSEESLNGDFASLMLAAALLVRGHEESKRKSERLKAAYAARRENGAKRISASAPHWLRFNEAANAWQLIPEHAETVREMFALSVSGLGVNAIAKQLNDRKRPPINHDRARGRGWYPNVVAKILRNRAVIGEHQPHAFNAQGMREPACDPIPDYFPRVVSDELFWSVQGQMNERINKGLGYRRDTGYGNILNGMLYCGYCGSKMSLEKKGPRIEGEALIDYYTYACYSASRHLTPCINRINYRALLLGAPEKIRGKYSRPLRLSLLTALFEYLLIVGEQLSDAADLRLAKAHEQHDVSQARLGDLERRKNNLIEAREAGLLTLAELAPRMEMIRAETQHAEAQRDEALLVMKQPSATDDSWLIAAVESHMAEIVPMLTESSQADARAALRVRLLKRVEAIYLYRECARVKLRHHDTLLFIPLQLGTEGYVADPDSTFPLPEPRNRQAKAPNPVPPSFQ